MASSRSIARLRSCLRIVPSMTWRDPSRMNDSYFASGGRELSNVRVCTLTLDPRSHRGQPEQERKGAEIVMGRDRLPIAHSSAKIPWIVRNGFFTRRSMCILTWDSEPFRKDVIPCGWHGRPSGRYRKIQSSQSWVALPTCLDPRPPDTSSSL